MIDRKTRQTTVALVLLIALALAGCVTYNGRAYTKLANDELVALKRAPADQALDPNRCLALNLGAIALRDTNGGTRSMNAPFAAGQHVGEMAWLHESQSSTCSALVAKDTAGEMTPDQRSRSRAAWVKTWANGRELLGVGSP